MKKNHSLLSVNITTCVSISLHEYVGTCFLVWKSILRNIFVFSIFEKKQAYVIFYKMEIFFCNTFTIADL